MKLSTSTFDPGVRNMRPCILLLTLLVVLAGCKPEDTPAALRLVRTLVVDPKSTGEDRQAIGEVKPRYESDLSFRVGGKVLSRLVDVGASVKQGDTLATLDTQDYQNRLRSAEADVSSAEAALVRGAGHGGAPSQAVEGRLDDRRRPTTPRCAICRPPRRGWLLPGQSRPHPRPAQLHRRSRPISTV